MIGFGSYHRGLLLNKYIALLRGINVGGKNKVSMKELKELLFVEPNEEDGFENGKGSIEDLPEDLL